MKQPRRRASKGRRPTPATLSVLELTERSITRHQAYVAGNRAALFDELNASLQAADDDPAKYDQPVTLPMWAFDVVYDWAMDKMLQESQGTGATARWWRQYRMDLIHGHRYALVKKAIKERRGYWPPKTPVVYEVVALELAGTAFAAKPSGIKSSYDVVTTALHNGDHARFYRSTAAYLYDFLLNTPGPMKTVYGALLVKSRTSVG